MIGQQPLCKGIAVLDITNHVTTVADTIHEMRASRARLIVAIAGAPASGKSTLATEVVKRLRLQRCPAEIVPMDGFHLDNAVLDARGMRARKGAPETFDATGFVLAIERLKSGGEVVVPRFDRQRDIAIAGAVAIEPSCPVVVVEGNYLLLDERPWCDLVPLWDLSVRIDVPEDELRGRLIQRWLQNNLSRAAATRRAESNDIPNARRVVAKQLGADIVLTPRS